MAHEQFDPVALLRYSRVGEEAGFDWIWCSDHFHPWFDTDASAGFAWSWMGTALAKVPRVRFGTGVTTPYLRYHPALVAQAFSTMGVMFPGRVFLGLGLGEAMNEVPLGYGWDAPRTRIAMFEEAVRVIVALWSGESVDVDGRYFRLEGARLYTLPKRRVPLIIATNHPTVAEIAGKYADGFYTASSDPSRIRNVLFRALERGAKSVGRDPEQIWRGFHMGGLAYGTRAQALEAYGRWRGTFVKNIFANSVCDPRAIERLGNTTIDDEQLISNLLVSKRAEDYIEKARSYIELGFDHIMLGSAGPDVPRFLRFVGTKVIPALKSSAHRS